MHVAYQAYVIALWQRSNFLLGQIANADETPIWFDMPSNTTVAETGSKEESFGNGVRTKLTYGCQQHFIFGLQMILKTSG